jgi:hypothetical protein
MFCWREWVRSLAAVGAVAALFIPTCRADEPTPPPAAADGDWIQLFNGKDLTGWTPKIVGHAAGDNFADTFRVEDGVLCVAYDRYEGPFGERFGHLFYNEPFSNYLLRAEYRLVGEQAEGAPVWGFANSGIMIYGQSPESMGRDQFFPVSVEVQLLAGRPGETRPTANVCTPGTHIVLDGKLHTPHCTNSKSKTYPIGEWVTVELEVHGGQLIRHKINGETVLEYSDPQLDPKDADARRLLESGTPLHLTGGTISLQSESHPLEFRIIELKAIDE